MQLKKGQIVTVAVRSLAFGGRGLGEIDGWKVFVDGVVPGDKVEASLTRVKEKWGEARLMRVVETSPDRVLPRCPYVPVCGGCQVQFLAYEKQLEYKRQQVRDCFERIGDFENPPVEEVIACDDPFYYRNKMEFTFGYDAEMNFALGLHLPGRRYDILDLKECFLQSERSVEILNLVRDFCLERGWQPRKFRDESGFLRSLFIREGKRTGEVMVVLMTVGRVPSGFGEDLVRLAEALKVDSFYWSEKIAKRGTPTKIKENLIAGKKTLLEKMKLPNGDEMEFEILPQAFFQVNTLQGEKLYQEVLKHVEEGQDTVFDLFCGTGTIGLFLAKHAKEVIGIDINEDAIKTARENALKNKITNAEFHAGDADKVLREVAKKASLTVVDPPRAGLSTDLIETVLRCDSPKIIYVSCNPATLARDVQIFAESGYKISSIQPVDMFPHTFHIENVCLLEK